MDVIHIDVKGLGSSVKLRQHVIRRFHSEFGLKRYMLHKIVIKLFLGDCGNGDEVVCCRVQAEVKNQPVVITELRSANAIIAIDLAIEHANLKLSHRINGSKEIRKRIQKKRNAPLYN